MVKVEPSAKPLGFANALGGSRLADRGRGGYDVVQELAEGFALLGEPLALNILQAPVR